MDLLDVLSQVILTMVPLILAIAVHEWAHVAMARFLGDTTGEAQGRFTLNPLVHIDPIWTLLLPTFILVSSLLSGGLASIPFFAAGKPAPYDPLQLRRAFSGKRITMRMGTLLVAIAGPVSNLVLAVLSVGLLFVALRTPGVAQSDAPDMFARFIVLNIGLVVFNMLPVPPLDGSKVLYGLLPHAAAEKYAQVSTQIGYVLLVILFMGGARFIIAPIQSVAMNLVMQIVR